MHSCVIPDNPDDPYEDAPGRTVSALVKIINIVALLITALM